MSSYAGIQRGNARKGYPLHLNLFIVAVLFKLVCDNLYNNVWYRFANVFSVVTNGSFVALSWICYIIQIGIICMMLRRKPSTTSIVYALLFFINGAGFFVLFGRIEQYDIPAFIHVNIFWLLFSLSVVFFQMFRSAKPQMVISVKNGDTLIDCEISSLEKLFFVCVVALSLFFSGVYGNFRIILSFSDVYQYRYALRMPSLVLYLFRFTSGVFLPYFFVRFLVQKRGLLVFFSFFLGLLLYSVDGLKTNLLLYFVIAGVYVLIRYLNKVGKPDNHIVRIGLFLIVIFMIVNYMGYLSIGEFFFLDELYRIFLIPSKIAVNYFNFIVEREPLLLRESIMRLFFESPYNESISFLVTDSVNQYGEAMANTGLFGDAYANFKLFGTVVYPFLYAWILICWQKINKNITSVFSLSIGVVMVWNATNISFFTWLLTGGVLVYFVITKTLLSKKIDVSNTKQNTKQNNTTIGRRLRFRWR